MSSGEWLVDGGPALASLLVTLWIGLVISHEIDHRRPSEQSPSSVREA
jgi:hypothetical protein